MSANLPRGPAARLELQAGRADAMLVRTKFARGRRMHELIRTNDPVLLSFVRATLADEGVDCLVTDGNMSVLEGSLGILASRVLVPEEDAPRARRALVESGLSKELRPETP